MLYLNTFASHTSTFPQLQAMNVQAAEWAFRESLQAEEESARASLCREHHQLQAAELKETNAAFLSPKPEIQRASDNLEERLSQYCVPKEDLLYKHVFFEDYIEPNENQPEQVVRGLSRITVPGVIVSVGTHRSLFDLILCDQSKCTGLVIVDINPQVKVFMDFLILLLKISDSMEEFAELSVSGINQDFQEKLQKIRIKTETSPYISEEMRTYYLSHLESHGRFYFSQRQSWKWDRRSFGKVHYHKTPDQFEILQRKAREGNIIVCEGDINELMFLQGIPIGAIDVSNVELYTPLDIKIPPGSDPILIRTIVGRGNHPAIYYFNKLPMRMRDEDRLELKNLLLQFLPYLRAENVRYSGMNLSSFISSYAIRDATYPGFALEYLHALRAMLEKPEWCLTSKGYRLLGKRASHHNIGLSDLPDEEIQKLRRQYIEKYGNDALFIEEAWIEWKNNPGNQKLIFLFSQSSLWEEKFLAELPFAQDMLFIPYLKLVHNALTKGLVTVKIAEAILARLDQFTSESCDQCALIEKVKIDLEQVLQKVS